MSCVEKVNHSLIKVEERRSNFLIKNDERRNFERHRIDNCVIKNGVRCDWAISDENGNTAFIELKGKDIEHGCRQLLETAEREECIHLMGGSIGFVLVCSNNPKFDSYTIKAKKIAMDKYKCGFHRVKPGKVMTIEEVIKIG